MFFLGYNEYTILTLLLCRYTEIALNPKQSAWRAANVRRYRELFTACGPLHLQLTRSLTTRSLRPSNHPFIQNQGITMFLKSKFECML